MRRAALLALVMALLAPAATPAHPAKHRKAAKQVRHDESARTVRTPPVSRPVHPPKKPPHTPGHTPPPPPKPRPLARIQVIAREYSLTLSRRALPTGRVAIELDNFGQDPHDLRVERTDAPSTGFSFTLAKPRTVSSQKVELSPGEWKLYCTLPGHEALGMSARVTVAG